VVKTTTLYNGRNMCFIHEKCFYQPSAISNTTDLPLSHVKSHHTNNKEPFHSIHFFLLIITLFFNFIFLNHHSWLLFSFSTTSHLLPFHHHTPPPPTTHQPQPSHSFPKPNPHQSSNALPPQNSTKNTWKQKNMNMNKNKKH